MRLSGRVAVVTGAGDGIGAAVARAYAAEGARVVVAELSEESGRAVAEEIDGLFVRTDVGKRDLLSAARSRIAGSRSRTFVSTSSPSM